MPSTKLRNARGISSHTMQNHDQIGPKPGLGGQKLSLPGATLGRDKKNSQRSVMYYNNSIVFCVNQVGGIGTSVGGRSLFRLMDGSQCRK